MGQPTEGGVGLPAEHSDRVIRLTNPIREGIRQARCINERGRRLVAQRTQRMGYVPVDARVGDLGPNETCRSPELGRPPFWERPSRALLGPEDMPRRVIRVGSCSAPAVNKGPASHPIRLFAAAT